MSHYKCSLVRKTYAGLLVMGSLLCIFLRSPDSNLPCYYGDVVGVQHDHTEEFCDQTDQPARKKQEKSISPCQSPKLYYSK